MTQSFNKILEYKFAIENLDKNLNLRKSLSVISQLSVKWSNIITLKNIKI